MNLKQIKELVASDEYDFLRTNEHLGDNIILLTLGGSVAYGTNIETSDLDVRGIARNKKSELLGLSNFDSFQNTKTDTTIYSFNNMVKLLLNVNPNIIEMLGCKEEHYLHVTETGQLLRDNVDLFLTQKAIRSFGGYANQQLRRLQNALARDSYPQGEKEQHILKSIENQMFHIKEHYADLSNHTLDLYIDESEKPDFEKEIFIDLTLDHYPLRDFKAMYSEMNNVIKDYGKLNHRNKKKDDLHLNKHSMHLVRLFLMATEILEGKGINTFRENDREMLLEIRHGKYQKEDGTYYQEFFELVNKLEKDLEYAKKNSPLPTKPDMKKVEEFVMEVNKRSL